MRTALTLAAFLAAFQTVYGLVDSTGPEVPSRRATIPIHLNSGRSLRKRSTLNGTGIQSLTITDDKQSYYAVIRTGVINFRVALDTGSSDLWLVSSSCSTKTCTSVPRYPLAYQSPSYVAVNSNQTAFNTHFADGTGASGFVARENVTYANLTLANQAFGLATSSNVTMDDNVSGILGLGFPRLSSISNTIANATPFFSNLAQQGQLDYPLFGLSLTRDTSGTLTIGAIDSAVVTNQSNIEWNPVVPFSPVGAASNTSSYLQWAIRLSGLAVNGTSITPTPTYPNATGNSSLALIDIGTSGIYGPYQDVSKIFATIDGSRLVDLSGQWALPCDSADTMSFTFGHQNFTLQPSDYLIGPTVGDPSYCLSWPKASAPTGDGLDWQLGSAFLRTVYSVFSFGIDRKETPMIGLYPLYAANTTLETPAAVSSFLASESATIATTLPNFPLSTPSYSTPAYLFNTSVTALASTGQATSTYSAILGSGTRKPNATALPTLDGLGNLATLVLTDSLGLIHTSTSTIAQPSVTLGEPPGWSGAASTTRIPIGVFCIPVITLILSSYIML